MNTKNDFKVWDITIQNPKECPCADLLLSGEKPIEGRTYKKKYREMKTGDFLQFALPDKTTRSLEIVDIRLYKTLEEYLQTEGADNALPGVTYERAIELYNTGGRNPPRPWSRPEEREAALKETGFGFMAIAVEPLPALTSST